MSRRTVLVASSLAVIILVAALVWSAGRDEQLSSFSIDIDASRAAATLAPGHAACQGPIQSLGPIGYVTLWAIPVGSGSALDVTVRDASGPQSLLGMGRVPAGYVGLSAPGARLNHPVPSGRTVSICLRDSGSGRVNLIGDNANDRSGVLTVDGRRQKDVLALYFQRARPVSLLSQVPAIFTRAALFRPTWVGSWTFWALAVFLMGTFGLAVVAVVQAERADARSSQRTTPQ